MNDEIFESDLPDSYVELGEINDNWYDEQFELED